MSKNKKMIDITEQVLEASVVPNKLRDIEQMMKNNKEPYIFEGRGRYDERATKADKEFEE